MPEPAQIPDGTTAWGITFMTAEGAFGFTVAAPSLLLALAGGVHGCQALGKLPTDHLSADRIATKGDADFDGRFRDWLRLCDQHNVTVLTGRDFPTQHYPDPSRN